MINNKVIIPGGAGLVGQNLVARLKARGYSNIVVIDKHRNNLAILAKCHQDIICENADVAIAGDWQRHFTDASAVVMLQAQIGGNNYQEFVRNNVESTRLILDIIKAQKIPRLIHVSSSVVESPANDFYTNTKKKQELLVAESGIPCPILRPTLMFGWFDRKHLGWLSRFMKVVPIFPIPGDGRYIRQPLYAGDFCQVIIATLENHDQNGIFNISGQEKINYVDIIRAIKHAIGARTMILHIPYRLFFALLWLWGKFDRNPPFTTQQLTALVAKDEFEIIDWPATFGISHTPFVQAIEETFNHQYYSHIALEF